MPATSPTDVNATRAKARDKSAARLSILDAARRLAAKNGIEKITLADVAAEAGIARATVYGYFRNREELLQSVVSDDLTVLTQAVAGVDAAVPAVAAEVAAPEVQPVVPDVAAAEPETHAVAPDAAAAPAADDTLQHMAEIFGHPAAAAIQPPLADVSVSVTPALPDLPADLSSLTAAAPEPVLEVPLPSEASPTVVDPMQELRAERRAHLETILSKLTPNDPPQSEGSAAALARFDRRLRVVERAVSDVQSQQERADKSTSTSVDSVSETLRGLAQRFEESERRQRETFAELRASAREAVRRLDGIEGTKTALPPEPVVPVEQPVVAPVVEPVKVEPAVAVAAAPVPMPAVVPAPAVVPETGAVLAPVEAPVEVTAAAPVEAVADVVVEKPEGDGEETPATIGARVTYLTAARNSARIAAEESAVEKKAKPKSWLYRIPKKYLMLTCAFMSVVVVGIGVLVVQRASAIAAQADTVSPELAKRASMHHFQAMPPQRTAMVAPLDEMTAMANGGNAKAQLLIGLKYLKGDGIAKNPVEAAQWIARSAKRGEPMAQYWAGYVYQHGMGVSADPDEALRWYEAAADQGNTKAMYNLGVGYAQGWTGARDAPEAARWFARAARLGYVDAQFNLAVLYERGEGVPPSLVDAYKWYAVATRAGDAESKRRLAAIETQLSPDDLAAAQRSAMIFRATPLVSEANTLPTLDARRG